MTAATASFPASTPRPVRRASALATVSAVAVLVTAALLVHLMAFAFRAVVPPIAAFVVVGFVCAAVIARGARWAPALAVVFGALFLAMNGSHVVDELAHPGGAMFAPVLLMGVAGVLAVAAGVAALVGGYGGRTAQPSPRWLVPALALVGGGCVGAIALSTAARSASATAVVVSPRTLATLPAVTTREFSFAQSEVRVRAGERVALRLVNADALQHSFDVDEFDVHVPMPGGGTAIALFTAGAPGRYTIYCAPHYDKRTKQGMQATLVVER